MTKTCNPCNSTYGSATEAQLSRWHQGVQTISYTGHDFRGFRRSAVYARTSASGDTYFIPVSRDVPKERITPSRITSIKRLIPDDGVADISGAVGASVTG